jgi:hypothetical protein
MGDSESGVKARTLTVIGHVREGDVAPLPGDARVCDRCAYDGACRRPRFVVSEEDEAVEAGARAGATR